jgi:hypothetical protein
LSGEDKTAGWSGGARYDKTFADREAAQKAGVLFFDAALWHRFGAAKSTGLVRLGGHFVSSMLLFSPVANQTTCRLLSFP